MKLRTLKQALIAGLASSALSGQAIAAGEFELTLSNSSVYAEASSTDDAPMQVSGGYLYHEESRNIFNLDLHAQNKSNLQGNDAHLGLGLRAIGYHEHDVDGFGFALGGFGEVSISKVPGLKVGGSAHYAPEILTFKDVDDFIWLEGFAGYAVIPNADVLAGYRYIKADRDDNDKSLESSAFVGIKFSF